MSTPQPALAIQADDATCTCGSGLLNRSCCGAKTISTPPPDRIAANESNFRAAVARFQGGDVAGAEAFCAGLLNQLPGHQRALRMLFEIHTRKGNENAAVTLLQRLGRLRPNDSELACELSMLLYKRRDLVGALAQARNAVRLTPANPQAHNLMGMVLTDLNRLPPGEYHYRKALALHKPVGKLCANLGLNLKNQGRLDEAETLYQQAAELEPDNVDTLLGWISLKQAARDLPGAWELLDKAQKMASAHPGVQVAEAELLKREKKYSDALATLDKSRLESPSSGNWPGHFYARGDILDKLGRYDEAFDAFAEANRLVRATGKRNYARNTARALANGLQSFFTRERVRTLPRLDSARKERVRPIFIVGFPRSGTTMVEQILTCHPAINAGDELPYIGELARIAPNLLNSELTYPNCMADLWFGENMGVLEAFRDYYLRKAEQTALTTGDARWFTDKMPLNETHLGLIHLVFPDSPIVHLIRHPLDVVLSTFSIDLTHGFNCSYELATAAGHYALVSDLVEHYRTNLDLNYLAVRYEDLVADPEPHCRQLLDFIGEDWDPRCLDFHENRRYARTASHVQVTERLYTNSVYRYRNYRNQMGPVIRTLQPAIDRLGYSVE